MRYRHDRLSRLCTENLIRIVYRFDPILALRGFSGLNYDGSVPGSQVRPMVATVPPDLFHQPLPACYAHETSYYAGGGVSVTW
jgi:hypothetical protein